MSETVERVSSTASDCSLSLDPLAPGEGTFRKLFEDLPDAILIHSDNKIVFANLCCARLLAAKGPEQLLGKSILEILDCDYLLSIENQIHDCCARGLASPAIETILTKCNGSSLEIEAVSIQVSWRGTPAIEVVLREIRERRQTERVALEWKQRLELAQKAGFRIGWWDWDVMANTVVWSDETYRQFGNVQDTFSGRVDDVVRRIRSDDRPSVAAAIKRVMAGDVQYSAQYRLVRPDGTTCWVDAHGVMIRDGSPHMIGIGVDITDLKNAEQSLREGEEKYHQLFDNATYGIFRSKKDGTLLDVNSALVTMLGYSSKEELLSRNLNRDVFENHTACRPMLDSYLSSDRVSGCEVNWRRRDGKIIIVRLTGGAFGRENDSVSHFEFIVEDITERRRLEREKHLLLEQERLARASAESAKTVLLQTLERISDGFLVLDRDWRCRYINEQWARYSGCRPEDLIGKNIWTEFPNSVDQSPYLLYRKAIDKQIVICEEIRFEKWDRWFDIRIYPSVDGLSIIFHETTERRESQQKLQQTLDQLRSLSVGLQTAREEERKRVARDLHDQIGQILTATKMDVDWVAKRIHQTDLRLRLGGTLTLIREATQSLRNICTELRPGVLDDLGLGAAIEWQANEFASRTGVQCEVSVPQEDQALDAQVSTAIFRIFQEALTNVVRHAEAKVVRVSLTYRNDLVVLMVQDDGKGILDSDLVPSKGSLGLLGMRERAQACGGTLRIWGEPKKGTTVIVEVPLSVKN